MRRTYTARCLQCGGSMQVPFSMEPPELCGAECRRERRRLQASGRPVPQRPPEAPLGPEVPLDGVAEEERLRQRDARILRALREGVDTRSICERFGVTSHVVCEAAARAGQPMPPKGNGWLPLGAPA